MKNYFLLIIFSVFLPNTSCKNNQAAKESFHPVFSAYKPDSSASLASSDKNVTFYGLLSPIEVCEIFNRIGINYSKSILNPVSNKDRYLSISKASINAGIYGADLGYLKMYGVGQEMIEYMLAIGSLCNELGIPDSFLSEPMKCVESDVADADTIMSLMNTSYYRIESHLRQGGRESKAGLMVMGGWIEAMYIATQLTYNPAAPDPQVIEQIAAQKYTLTTLLSFLKNYYDDPVVVYYTRKLKFLKNYFDTFDIIYRKGDLEIDTARQLFRSSGSQMTITVQTLNNIRDYISRLRTESVTP